MTFSSGTKQRNLKSEVALWLKEFGFSEGTQIQVQCEDGKLIVTPRLKEDSLTDIS